MGNKCWERLGQISPFSSKLLSTLNTIRKGMTVAIQNSLLICRIDSCKMQNREQWDANAAENWVFGDQNFKAIDTCGKRLTFTYFVFNFKTEAIYFTKTHFQ